MPNNLDKVVLCESRVTTRLRYVHKSTGIYGSQTTVVTRKITVSLNGFAESASIDLSALNGVYITKDTASGVDSPQLTEELSVANEI